MRGVSKLLVPAGVVVVVLVAGCVSAPSAANHPASEERLGWENGVSHNESIPVDLRDGASEREQELLLARTMARVEYLRGHEFTRSVQVAVMTRSELRARVEASGSFGSDEELTEREARIMNGFWEALFFVGQDRDAVDVRASETSGFLGAFYVFGTDEIRVITDGAGNPRLSERLLVHELMHALQDEYGNTPLATRSDDDSYATSALIEGDAELVEYRYRERCRTGKWECLEPPERGGSSGERDTHRGFRALRSFAYSDGVNFVNYLYETGRFGETGWAAVDAAYRERPRTTEEIIHPEQYPAAPPNGPSVPDDHAAGWDRLGGPYTVGELEMFGMFWYQGAGYDNDVIDTESFYEPDGGELDRYNYSSEPSVGWDGDGLTIVSRDDELGYVWVTRWDTTTAAGVFREAYLDVLAGHGARSVGSQRWVIQDGPFTDAFAVVQNGQRVKIVNGPTVGSLSNIDPTLASAG